jgi:hypothetical protein
MKKTLIVVFAFLTLGCATSGAKIAPDSANMARASPNITPEMIAKNPPDSYCEVVADPNPILLGGWMTRVGDNNPVEFWLVKKEDRYAFYFFLRDNSLLKERLMSGWSEMILNGDWIYSPGMLFNFYTEGGKVYYRVRGGTPWEMKRIEVQ